MAKDKAPEEQTAHTEPTAAQIKEWKEKHGDLFELSVKADDGSQLKAILRQPVLVDIQRAKASEAKKVGTMEKSIYENCVLSENPEIRKNDRYFMSAVLQLGEIVNLAEVSIVKL